MPTFHILRRVGKTGGKPLRVEATRLTIGRAADAGLSLEDALVSERHASLEWRGAECVLRDEGSETGTYLDDRAIPEGGTPIGAVARVLVGRVPIQATVNFETREVLVSTIERTLSGERVLAAASGARGRPAWRRPLLLGIAGLLASVLPFVALAAAGITGLFTKGELARAHQVDARAGGVSAVRCDACHTPFRGTEGRKCAACHARTVGPGTQHPISNALFADASCAGCHDEHRGAGARLTPEHVPYTTCRGCHEGAHSSSSAHPERSAAGGGAESKGREQGARAIAPDEPVPFAGFSHAEHVVGRIADCTQCHRPLPSTVTGAARRDFAVMTYEGCVGCHEHESRKVEAHGTNAQCTACHAGPNERALRMTVASIERAPRAAPPAQAHALSKTECAPCHMDAPEARAARAKEEPSAGEVPGGVSSPRAGAFDHFAHLSSLAPARPQDVPDVVAQCVECHAGIASAATVEAARAMPPPADCARCHTGGAIAAGAPALVTTMTAVVFSHAAHAGAGRRGAPGAALPGGSRRLSPGARALHDRSCLACHAFAKDAPGTPPSLGAAQADCAACHTRRHEDAGLEQCAFCHRGRDDLFEPRPLARPSYGPIRFEHASRTHATVACAECHGDVAKAVSLDGLRYPRFASPECQRCHAARAGGDLDCAGCHKMHAR